MSAQLQNWAGNYAYRAARVEHPTSLAQLRRLVAGAGSLRAVATRHTFTGMGDADTLVGLEQLPGADTIAVDPGAMTVSVGPTVTFAELAVVLNRAGLALANLASLPHISVCGALATATHGSGDRQGNLATSLRGMTLLTSSGDLLTLSGDDPRLAGAAVHLGLLGLVLEVTLAVLPYYEVRQNVFEDLKWGALLAHFDEVFALGRSVSVFHALGHDAAQAVWVKSEPGTELPVDVFGAAPASGPRHPLPGGDVSSCTVQLGEPGPWSERLPHFRSGFMPSNGTEIQSEVFVERRHAVDAVAALLELRTQLTPALFVGELRTVAADALWLSPQFGRDCLGIHFTWQRDPAAVAANVALIEAALAPFSPRPHWGKVMATAPDRLAGAYERFGDFARLRADLDPRGTFVTDWARERLPRLVDG
jgi:xylitol oxidase